MADGHRERIGLVVRSGPGEGRSGRDSLDVALACAAAGLELDLFFIGSGVLQLLDERNPGASGWPGGHRGWGGLPELTSVRGFVEASRYRQLADRGAAWLLETTPLETEDMVPLQRACQRLLVI